MICNNCGIMGHSYKQCKLPIMSYGIILFKHGESDKILMLQRKDSLSYIDFIRGKYNVNNIEYILKLCNNFSIHEKENIKKYSYDELWKQLWNIDAEDIKAHIKNEYKRGKEKFTKLQQGYKKDNKLINIDFIYNNIHNPYECSEWEFPKGRRNENETNRECAIREFTEETNIKSDDYILFTNISPISEEYYGENNIKYKHIYYLGMTENIDIELKIDPSNKEQINEVSDIQWLTYDESNSKIRSYNNTKYEIIDRVFNFINNYRKDLFICTSSNK